MKWRYWVAPRITLGSLWSCHVKISKQESPPAWPQEAYRPPRTCFVSQSSDRGVPPSSPDGGGVTPSSPDRDTPIQSQWEYPPYIPDDKWSYPPAIGKDGGNPQSGRMGYPTLRPDVGTPLPRWPDGVPPPPSRCGQTQKVKVLASPILWMRAVIKAQDVHFYSTIEKMFCYCIWYNKHLYVPKQRYHRILMRMEFEWDFSVGR